jgi:hypothetical protein
LLELVLPFCFVWILVAIKNATNFGDPNRNPQMPAFLPPDYAPLLPLYYNDYVLSLASNKVCTTKKDDSLDITGVYNSGNGWQIPFVRCDPRKCQYVGQDATPFCEYSILAVAGIDTSPPPPPAASTATSRSFNRSSTGNFNRSSTNNNITSSNRTETLRQEGVGGGGRQRALDFQSYVYAMWPALQRSRRSFAATMNATVSTGTSPMDANATDRANRKISVAGMPFDFPFVQIFASPEDMDEYIRHADYGKDATRPKIAMGIVFDGNDRINYTYWIRQNSTNMNVPAREVPGQPVARSSPPTDAIFRSHARTDIESCVRPPGTPRLGKYQDSCTGLYLYNGVLATQRLVGDYILNRTGAADAGYRVAQSSVGFVQFPQKAYVLNGFFTTVRRT